MTYALDANTISYILRNEGGVKERWRQEEVSGNKSIIPLIAYYEVKRGLLAKGATTKLRYFDELCDVLGTNVMTISEINTASKIYSNLMNQGLLIDDADILIAAQCIENGYTLVTGNTRHFERIDGLKLVDWYEAVK